MTLTPRQKLSAAVTRVCDPKIGWAPYFGVMLRGFVRVETPAISTMAVSATGVLLWSPDFVTRVTVENLAFALMHETLHVLLKVWERGAALGVIPERTSDAHAKASQLNRAHDACINESLREIEAVRPHIPEWVVTPESLGQPPKLVLEERYRLLREKERDEDPKPMAQQVGGGWCGGCAGHPVDGEPNGVSPESRSEAEMNRFRKETAEAIKHACSKNPGSVPAELQRFADAVLAPPRIDWRTRLARTVRSAVAYRAGAVDFTWSRPSRRQAGIGYGIGRPAIPAMHAPQPNVACIIDTSGSMGEDDLTAAASEVQGILAAVGATVTVCVVDADVHGVKPVATVAEAITMMKGGGGTDMTPGFDELAKLRTPPSVIIVLTDGHIGGGHPEFEPAAKTVWVVIGENGNRTPCPWGEVVCIDEPKAEAA